MSLWGCVCAREKESEWEREHSKQWTVQSDEADGNHSLGNQGRDKEGEEETGLAVKSTTHKNNILSHFQRRHGTDFCNAKKNQAVTLSWLRIMMNQQYQTGILIC